MAVATYGLSVQSPTELTLNGFTPLPEIIPSNDYQRACMPHFVVLLVDSRQTWPKLALLCSRDLSMLGKVHAHVLPRFYRPAHDILLKLACLNDRPPTALHFSSRRSESSIVH